MGAIGQIAYSNDGRLIGVAGETGFGWWDAQSGTLQRKETAPKTLRIAFSASGNFVAAGGADGRVLSADLRVTGSREAARHTKPVRAIALQADGRLGASGDSEGTILLWDPAAGPVGTLKDGSSKAEVLYLAFSSASTLLAVAADMTVTTWDVNGKRSLRRGGLQTTERGRQIDPAAASLDTTGAKLVVAAQMSGAARIGAVTGGMANPRDLRRDNVLLPYDVASGISSDAIVTGDFKSETVATSPSGCYAFFTSNYRDQPRVHVWGMVEKGDDLLRQDLPRRAEAIALDGLGRALAIAVGNGKVATFRVSGTTVADCEIYARKPTQAAGPKITVGSETSPLIQTAGTRVAVLRFDTNNASSDLGDGVAEMISGELANSASVVVIERGAINAIVKEMELQRSGLTDSDAVRIGKGLNAKKVLLGSVRRFGEDTFLLTVRVVDVETQRNEGQREVTCENCKEQNVLTAAKELRRLLVR